MLRIISLIYQWILKILGVKKGEEDVPQGLQCFDASGNLMLDVTDRLTVVLGNFDTGTENGSIANAALLLGEPWYYVSSYATDYFTPPNWRALHVSVSGQTLSWVHQTNGVGTANYNVVYGVC